MDYFKNYLTPSYMFCGTYDANKDDYKMGDVCLTEDGEIHIYLGDNKWDVITETSTCTEVQIEEVEILPKICSRCGAPLRYHVCEYCGTRY